MDETSSEHRTRAALVVIGSAAITAGLVAASRLLADDSLGVATMFGLGLVLAEVMGARSGGRELDRRLAPTSLPLALSLSVLSLPGLLLARGVAIAAALAVGGRVERDRGARATVAVLAETVVAWSVWSLAPTDSIGSVFGVTTVALVLASIARDAITDGAAARQASGVQPLALLQRSAMLVVAAAVHALMPLGDVPAMLGLAPLPLIWLLIRSEVELADHHDSLLHIHELGEGLARRREPSDIAETACLAVAEAIGASAVGVRFWCADGPPIDASTGGQLGLTLPASPSDGATWVQVLATAGVTTVGRAPRGERRQRTVRAAGQEPIFIASLLDARGSVGVMIARGAVDDDHATAWMAALSPYVTTAVRASTLPAASSNEVEHDPLTGLANRTHYSTWVRRYLSAGHTGTAMLVDLDRFKEINDSFGHRAGDRVLIEAARRLNEIVRTGDQVARLSADEFVVFMPGLDESGALARADAVAEALEEPFVFDAPPDDGGDLQRVEVAIGASIGVASAPGHATNASALLRAADLAMYHAKRLRVRAVLYDDSFESRDERRLTLLTELRSAIRNEQLTVHYQPQVAIDGGAVIGVEALVRWRHPLGEWIPPDVFVELAEQAGLIDRLTEQVLSQASTDVAALVADGFDLRLSVNLSAQSLLDARLEHLVLRGLEAGGLTPDRLTLEITETTMMGDGDRTEALLRRLAVWGIEISVDDFGTGFSSLVSLRQMPIAEVKIDRSFVMQMAAEREDAVIVRSTIELAHNLGLIAIAEGVEDLETMQRLRELGCDVAQGFGLSRPLPIDELRRWLARWTTDRTGFRAEGVLDATAVSPV